MSATLSTAALLRRAAEVLRERGWTKGTFEDENGCVCVIGACIVASGGEFMRDEEGVTDYTGVFPHVAVNCISRATGAYSMSLWNDNLRRTLSEVLAALDRAAVLAEQEGAA